MYKKWKSRKLSVVAGLVFLVFMVSQVPLLIVGSYACPCADDYTYGSLTHAVWQAGGNLGEVMQAALQQVRSTYDTWQGTFSSVFLMTLSPVVWGEKGYGVTTVLMLGALVISHFYLFYILMVKCLKTEQSLWVITSSAVCFLMIQSVHSPINALFWFNGAVHYTFMHGCMIGLIGIVVHIPFIRSQIGRSLALFIGCALCILCGGANFSTALCGMVCLLGVLLLQRIVDKKWSWGVILLPIYTVAFFFSIVAPGNGVRQTNFIKMGVLESVIFSFRYWGIYAKEWISISLLFFILLLLPVLVMVVRRTTIPFRFPGLVTVVSICVNACLFTPSFYSMGIPGPDRLLNIGKYTYILLLVINICYWLGYFIKKRKNFWSFFKGKALIGYLAVVVCLILVSFKTSGSGALTDYSSYAAYVSLMAGEAQQFRSEYESRLEILLGEKSVVGLKPYTVKPYLLFFDDIQSSQSDWRNDAVAGWYGKDAVYLLQE